MKSYNKSLTSIFRDVKFSYDFYDDNLYLYSLIFISDDRFQVKRGSYFHCTKYIVQKYNYVSTINASCQLQTELELLHYGGFFYDK